MSGQSASEAHADVVARLSLLEGEAHVTTAGAQAESVDAVLNMPLAAGQSLHTGRDGDAEVEFPDGSVLRPNANSVATVIRLQPQTEIGLDDGLYYLELRAGTASEYTVFAGNLSIEPKGNASFRVRVENGEPEIAVLRGTVSVTEAGAYTVDVQHGESLRTDAKDSRRYLLAEGIQAEAGDTWNERLAQHSADAAATETVAREDYAGGQGYGWSDLDSSGSWYPLPGEGLVWQPSGIDASFDPYGYGNWVYGGFGSGYGGYVWASGYSWGWLPYHCGSWGFFSGFGWGWQPSAGCVSYGGGWPAHGFPVQHPPHGWHGPHPPREPGPGGIVPRHPTLPVATSGGATHQIASGPRAAQPLQWNGITLRPLAPVAAAPLPHGSSAVGSALRRDYPIQSGTHRPDFGLERPGSAVIPGRTPDWHILTAARTSEGEERRTGATAVSSPIPGHTFAQGDREGGNPSAAVDWHSRIRLLAPNLSRTPGAGPVSSLPTDTRPVPGPAGATAYPSGPRVPAAPAAPRPAPAPSQPSPTAPQPIRPAPAAPVRYNPVPAPAPRFNPSPAPAPHFNPPPSAPVHMPPPSAPSGGRTR